MYTCTLYLIVIFINPVPSNLSVHMIWLQGNGTHTHTHTLSLSPLSFQVMVNSDVSGVAFSRHPLTPLSSDTVLVEAVYGLGEGLVSGELEADRYDVIQLS